MVENKFTKKKRSQNSVINTNPQLNGVVEGSAVANQELAERHMANDQTLRYRASVAAHTFYRDTYSKRFGKKYDQLNDQQKSLVNKSIKKNIKQVRILAKRMYLKIKSKDMQRLKTKPTNIEPLKVSIPAPKPLNDKITKSLNDKATKHNIDVKTLVKVFNRGQDAWTEDTKYSPEQFAFNRVNSFISGGKARELDMDLWEAAQNPIIDTKPKIKNKKDPDNPAIAVATGNPITETGGAGDWGTSKLTNKYKKDTPGQHKTLIRKIKEQVKNKTKPPVQILHDKKVKEKAVDVNLFGAGVDNNEVL